MKPKRETIYAGTNPGATIEAAKRSARRTGRKLRLSFVSTDQTVLARVQ